MHDFAMPLEPSPSFTPDAGATPLTPAAIHDFLQQQQQQAAAGSMHMNSSVGQSPQADFAELLAEFTASNSNHAAAQAAQAAHTGSPDALGKSPGAPTHDQSEQLNLGRAHKQPRERERTAQEILLEQLGFPLHQYTTGSSARSPASSPSAATMSASHSGQLGHHYAQLAQHLAEPARTAQPQRTGEAAAHMAPAHVTQALLNMDPGTRSHLLSSLLALKQQQQLHSAATAAVNSPRSAPSPRQAMHSNSPRTDANFSNHPSPLGSMVNSPQHFSSTSSPMPRYHQSAMQQQQQQQYPSAVPPGAVNTSHPSSLVSSPAASPYLAASLNAPTPTQQVPSGSTMQPAYSSLPAALQNVFGAQNAPSDPNTQAQEQAQLALDYISRSGQYAGDMNMRGQMTGESYATTVADRSEFGDNDFIFSPLMSPALTPQSVFTAASSVPTSSSFVPSNSFVSPADFFSPLSSPAITPQFHGDNAALQQQRAVLQGLVDQTRALGFDQNAIGALANAYSSPVIQPQAGVSPRLGPSDAGQSTATGTVRRGASSKKTRPSPLLKATPDGGPLRRKKATGAGERRSTSVGSSSGLRSATGSPYMAPSNGRGPRQGQTSTKTSPTDGNTTGGNNTPSPVDLTMSEASAAGSAAQFEQPGLMGPPPLPNSLNGASALQQDWLNPATPATLMNLPSNLGGSAIKAALPAATTSSSRPPKSNEQRSTSQSPASSGSGSKPSPPFTLNFTPIAPAPPKPEPARIAPKPSIVANKAVHADVSASPASSKLKGKARAAASSTGLRKPAGKKGPSPKIAPTTKIKPLLANGSTTDGASFKSNGQVIAEDDGGKFSLDDSLDLSGTANGGGPDVRKTSHKAAEQKRRDSLKARFEELRGILPPIALTEDPADRQPGEGNVGGSRHCGIDRANPNRGVSKVALLRRNNEYIGMLQDRISRRDKAIETLRSTMKELRTELGRDLDVDLDEVPGLDLDNIDKEEKAAGTIAFYENLDDEDEDVGGPSTKAGSTASARKPASRRRSSILSTEASSGTRRSARRAAADADDPAAGEEPAAMDVEV